MTSVAARPPRCMGHCCSRSIRRWASRPSAALQQLQQRRHREPLPRELEPRIRRRAAPRGGAALHALIPNPIGPDPPAAVLGASSEPARLPMLRHAPALGWMTSGKGSPRRGRLPARGVSDGDEVVKGRRLRHRRSWWWAQRCWLAAPSRRTAGVYGWEVAIFQAVNGLPGSLRPLLWVLNQYGTAITIPVATIIALAFRRWVLAAALAISGVTVYVLAKVIKGYVDRGRPSALIESVVERGPSPRKASATHQAMQRWRGRSRSSCWPSQDVLAKVAIVLAMRGLGRPGCTWRPTCHST